MRILLTGMIMMLSIGLFAQKKTYEVSKDAENGQTVYKGKLTYRDLEYDMPWFKPAFDEYEPDAADQEYLQQHMKDYKMVIFMGTWCDDSQIVIPQMFKVFINTFYTGNKYQLYGVDRAKTALKGEEKPYNIKLVPTIIVLDGDKEIGRIVEHVNKSVEADIASIIKAHKNN